MKIWGELGTRADKGHGDVSSFVTGLCGTGCPALCAPRGLDVTAAGDTYADLLSAAPLREAAEKLRVNFLQASPAL